MEVVAALEYSMDGFVLFSSTFEVEIRMWNVGSAELIRVVANIGMTYPNRMVFNPSNLDMVVCNYRGGNLEIWNTETRSIEFSVPNTDLMVGVFSKPEMVVLL